MPSKYKKMSNRSLGVSLGNKPTSLFSVQYLGLSQKQQQSLALLWAALREKAHTTCPHARVLQGLTLPPQPENLARPGKLAWKEQTHRHEALQECIPLISASLR